MSKTRIREPETNGRAALPAEVPPPDGHVVVLSDDELFAANVLASLTIQGLQLQGEDPDALYARFYAGKVGLKAKLARATAFAQPAEKAMPRRTPDACPDPAA